MSGMCILVAGSAFAQAMFNPPSPRGVAFLIQITLLIPLGKTHTRRIANRWLEQ